MMMAISPLARSVKTEAKAAPASSSGGDSFADMLGGATARAPVSDGSATPAAPTSGKPARTKVTAVDATVSPVAMLIVAPPVPIPPVVAPQPSPVATAQATSDAASAATAMPAPAAQPTPGTATGAQPVVLSPEEMTALAPALQLLAQHAGADDATSAPAQVSTQDAAPVPVPSAAAPSSGGTFAAVDMPAPAVAQPTSQTDRAQPDPSRLAAASAAPDTTAVLSARAGTRMDAKADKAAASGASGKAKEKASADAALATNGPDVTPQADTVSANPPAAKPVATPAEAVQPAPARDAQGVAVASAQTDGKTERAASRKDDDRSDEATDGTGQVAASTSASLLTAAPATIAGHAASPSLADAAGQLLVQGGADRQLDLAKTNAWLDGISRDIAATGDAKGTLRFEVAPQQLGAVSVALSPGDDGTAVTITAASEKARDLIADAKPQLIAEAQANGFRIASAQVDVSSQQQSSDQGRNGQTAQQHQQHQQAAQQGQAGGGSSFAQAGTGGDGSRQPQTRSQLLADTPLANPFHGGATADSVEDAPSADGLYA